MNSEKSVSTFMQYSVLVGGTDHMSHCKIAFMGQRMRLGTGSAAMSDQDPGFLGQSTDVMYSWDVCCAKEEKGRATACSR